MDVLPSEGYLTDSETADGSREIEEKISDFLLRIAEYAFIAARQSATWDIGHAMIPMSRFSVIYIKRTKRTPAVMTVTFLFPDGQSVEYTSDNAILEELTKEDIVSEGGIEEAVADLEYMRDEMQRLNREGENDGCFCHVCCFGKKEEDLLYVVWSGRKIFFAYTTVFVV